MYRQLSLLAVLGLLLTACAPYGGGGYYRTDVYSVDRYDYPGYYRPAYPYNRGYYVVPQQPRYYAPAPRYYQPAPGPSHRPYPGPGRYDGHGPGRPEGGWNRGPDRNDHGWNRGPDRNDHNWSRGPGRDDRGGGWRGNRGDGRGDGRNGDRNGDRGRDH
ncbi:MULTISPECIES: hypothetical protein [unclassified Pseudomonas]|uniref:hypothetical protein n=1 Tax=unclassified Pseudomonas TaxID=196821 RepID=UPI0021C5FA09|nr:MULTISPECIES: hypothetical protein [unclassified Pseudomonas]MCU1732214.1 hypothetical protein [Pseudomonas sp. 20P_3.2_Bac4]MCU1744883.1 hypothetical protein [Pseudomonas sp. 20P_3.2_Bac5]